MNSTKAIYERLTGSPGVMFALDDFEGLPAIFDDLAPDEYLADQEKPCIVISPPSSDTDASTLTETIRAVTQDVRFYAKHSGDNQPLDDLARHCRDLFHLRADEIHVDCGTCSIATATGPVASPTSDPSLVGRRITLRLQLERN